jgi:hypothetical protein
MHGHELLFFPPPGGGDFDLDKSSEEAREEEEEEDEERAERGWTLRFGRHNWGLYTGSKVGSKGALGDTIRVCIQVVK